MTRRSPLPLLRAALVLLPAICVVALTWFVTLNAQPPATALPTGVAGQVRRQAAAMDHRLNEMIRTWRQDPRHFSVASWNSLLSAADGRRPDVLLVSPQGVIIDATGPGVVGLDVHGRDWFRSAQDRASRGDTGAVTTVGVDSALHDWHLRVARWLPGPNNRFDGVLMADTTLDALNGLFRQAPPLTGATGSLLDAHTALWLQAGAVTLLVLLLSALLLAWSERARRQRFGFARERGMLAVTNGELHAARARADAKAAQLEATVTGISDGVALLDAQLRLVEWNQHFAELAGVPARLLRSGTSMEEILQAQAEAGEFGHVAVQAEVARRLAVLRTLCGEQTAERTRPDGRVIELRRNPLPDGGFVTLYRDVTGRRRAETAMREARALAEAATAAKSRFVAIVSHEIRSPLGALLNTLQLLGGGSLPASQQALLRMAHQSGEALLGLINDILDMSSMEAGQLALRPSAFVLAPLLDSVVDMFQAQAAERGITLRLAIDPSLPAEMYADPGRLRQVLINLLANAVKFGIPGPVALLARQDADEHGRSLLSVAVRDRGPVIEEAGRARLFRPFSRLDLTGGEPLGSGLGLAICRYLVTLMGGEIGCRTWLAEDGHAGNEFWINLPLTPVPVAVRRQSTAPETSARLLLPRTRVLLVEDSPANQMVTALLLRREGHLVDVADTGEAALHVVAQLPYDLVFTDIHLPGMGGLELAGRIRALPGAGGAVPIVALSANTGPDDRLACERAGILELIDKPVALADLLAALGRHVWRGRPAHLATLQPAAALPALPLLAEERISELRTHLPPNALRDMVQGCLIDLQARLPALRRALLAGNSAEAANQAHAMVGMAAGYGMATLEARLRALMVAARGPHAGAATELLRQLELDMGHSAQALREALQIELV